MKYRVTMFKRFQTDRGVATVRRLRIAIGAGWSVGIAALLGIVLFAGMSTAAEVEFTRDIQPMLAKRCHACHGALQQKSGLRLDATSLILKGGEGGPVLVPGDPAASRLVDAMLGLNGLKMPPEGEGTPPTAEEVELVKQWIAGGAKAPANEVIPEDPRKHWSYQPVRRPVLPLDDHAVWHRDWVRSPVDTWIAREHAVRGLRANPPAAKEIWFRRAHLDLVGLPPDRQALHDFVLDAAPDATDRVVDRLLASPHYGERWGRHWMDVWRYSDWYGSRGINEIRYSQRHIWRWRDWIVDSLNGDKSYFRMIVEMLAADEVAPSDPASLVATGFLGRNWYKFDRNVWMFDLVEHSSQALLGMTIKCARCHDHKYDPITQEEYYRLRAFFEPHDVRTDAWSEDGETEKDATLGPVLKVGLSRVFDKQPDAKTFLFQRGDGRYPDETRPLEPGVPKAFGDIPLQVESISLPVESFYPSLQPPATASLRLAVRKRIGELQKEAVEKQADVTRLRERLATVATKPGTEAATESDTPRVLLRDEFNEPSGDRWKFLSGQWAFVDGALRQTQVTSFATAVCSTDLPADFRLRLKYRTLQPGTIRSVGFSFDYQDQGNSQDVYTSTGDQSQSVQAFHRTGGQQVYPQAGIVKTTLKVGEECTVEIEARGPRLLLSLNGERRLDYAMPVARKPGKVALWVHDGAAEFLDLEVTEAKASVAELQAELDAATHLASLADQQLRVGQAEAEALEARIDAERKKYYDGSEQDRAAAAARASQAERRVAAAKAATVCLETERKLEVARRELTAVKQRSMQPGPSQSPDANRDPSRDKPTEQSNGQPNDKAAEALAAELKAKTEAEQAAVAKWEEARKARDAAEAAVETPDGKYAPLGEVYPATSTGRRAALARWIAHPENPRTARVAMNQVWLRLFGEAIVPSVANFGLNGDRPSHPQLLDWLASEFQRRDGNFKPIVRSMVLSATYGMSSVADGNVSNVAADPGNKYLWRMNSRRMQAEVVRDSLLAVSDELDAKFYGPEIPEGEGLRVPRRSLYFRSTPNEKMRFLELFDVADPNACYRRRESVVPQQSLALLNSSLSLDLSRSLAAKLLAQRGGLSSSMPDAELIRMATETVLGRTPSESELEACHRFWVAQLATIGRADRTAFAAGGGAQRPPSEKPEIRVLEQLIQVLYNHNDFITIR